jgi:hypothetical protein
MKDFPYMFGILSSDCLINPDMQKFVNCCIREDFFVHDADYFVELLASTTDRTRYFEAKEQSMKIRETSDSRWKI